MRAAQMALTKAMKANPVVTRPSDVKTLVDAAANAMKLVDQLQSQQAGKGMKGEIAAEISKTLRPDQVARRKDVEFIVRAAAKAAADASGQPLEPIFQAAALGCRVAHRVRAASSNRGRSTSHQLKRPITLAKHRT